MTEKQSEWRRAQNLDDAWSNFAPYYPLPSGSPFYVPRKDSPLDQLQRSLLRRHDSPQKYFFSGFMGCGKSTELNRLATNTDLNRRYFVVKFSIRETCDLNNLNYVDVLVAIGARIFESSTNQGCKLDARIYHELKTWGQRVEERIKEKGIEALAKAEGGVGLESPKWIASFFLRLTGKIQAEYSSRKIIRETLEPTLTDLLAAINLIASGILAKTKQPVLVLVDDLDKAGVDDALGLFKDSLAALLQPSFYMLYTVPVWVFYSSEFPSIRRPNAFLLPNVKLHPKGHRDKKDQQGFKIMRDFVFRRMSEKLISTQALNYAIKMSGGVFRELARIMQITVDFAIERDSESVQITDVKRAVNELRNEFRRILEEGDYEALNEIYRHQDYEGIDRIRHLLERLLVLEYVNDENWLDIHPVLEEIVQAWSESSKNRSSPKSS